MVKKKQQYDGKKTLEKVLKSLANIGIASLVVYISNQPFFIWLVPILVGVENWYKHKDGSSQV